MVYAGTCSGRPVTLGVSGRLRKRNLLMWDRETDSLWSQILGKAVYGDRKGQHLEMVPAVFVGFGTWKKIAPKTQVLDLSPVGYSPWYYTTRDLARGGVSSRGGGSLAIGLRHGGDTLAVPLKLLHEKGLVEAEVGGIPVAVVWVAAEQAALVYRRTASLVLKGGILEAAGGDGAWDALTGKPVEAGGRPLARFPYIPTYLRAWKSYYPEGRIQGE